MPHFTQSLAILLLKITIISAVAYLELAENIVTVDVLLGIAAFAGYHGQAVHLHDSFDLKSKSGNI